MARKVRRRFDISKLPKDVSEKIHRVFWADSPLDYGEGILGRVYLNDGWVAIDGGNCMDFLNRADLIKSVKEEVTRAEDFQV